MTKADGIDVGMTWQTGWTFIDFFLNSGMGILIAQGMTAASIEKIPILTEGEKGLPTLEC